MQRLFSGVLIGLFSFALLAPHVLVAQDQPDRQAARFAVQSAGIIEYLLRTATPPRWEPICGATFISPSRTLTAAHCLVFRTGLRVRDSFGDIHEIEKMQPDKGRDLAVLYVVPIQNSRVRTAEVGTDVAVGDTVWLTGVPDGNDFMVTRGMVGRIVTEKFENCDAGDPTGTTRQQLLITDVRSHFGNSGGGYTNQSGQLVGVHVRANYGGLECNARYQGHATLWGFGVSASAILDFLKETATP